MYEVMKGGILEKDRRILVMAAGELSHYAEYLEAEKISKIRLDEAFDEIFLNGAGSTNGLFTLCEDKSTRAKNLETVNLSQPNMAFGQHRKKIRRKHGELRNSKTVLVTDADCNKLLVRANLDTWELTIQVNGQDVEYTRRNYRYILAIYLNMAISATIAAPDTLLL